MRCNLNGTVFLSRLELLDVNWITVRLGCSRSFSKLKAQLYKGEQDRIGRRKQPLVSMDKQIPEVVLTTSTCYQDKWGPGGVVLP